MSRPYLTLLFVITSFSGWAQLRTFSLGIFTGITTSYSYDDGIGKDQRYQSRYDVKFAPIGINYGIDFDNVGILLSPGLTTIGQNFQVVNTTGGHEGIRKINLQYLNIPIACKLRLIDMSFFRVSVIGSVSVAYLLKGKESISHDDAKLKFLDEIVPPVLPPDYIREYDGVLSPAVSNYTMLTKNDFKSMQFFVAAGLRSDWDMSETWRVSFDLRLNYGLLEPRNNAYLTQLSGYQTLYDISGSRRDMFVQFTIGIAKIVEVEKNASDKRKKIKGSPKRSTPKRYPWPKPRN